MRVRTLQALAALVLTATGLLLAQGPGDTPQFQGGIELIQLDVSVLDGRRRPVRGLTAADFTVLDNGVPRPIRAFTPVELARRQTATEPTWAATAPPDIATNRVGEEEGRLVVIVMDRSIPAKQPTVTARKVAIAVVESLGTNDLAAVVTTNYGRTQNLTSDRARLLRAIHASDPSAELSKEALDILNPPTAWFKVDTFNDTRCLCGLCVLDTIRGVADAMQDAPQRRKLLFFIGSNMIIQSSRPIAEAGQDPGCNSRIKTSREAMFASVDRANLTVHALDPSGLTTVGPQTNATARGRREGSATAGPGERFAQQESEMTTLMKNQETLRVLPKRTGGRTVVNTNGPDRIVPQIFLESEAYYVIGFEPAAREAGDAPRTIEVTVNRKGVRVYSQRQYKPQPASNIATVATENPTAQDALQRLLPNRTKPLSLSVTALASRDTGRAVVVVNVDARSFASVDGRPVPLGVALVAVDPTGRPVASVRQTSTVTGARLASGDPAEVNVQSHLELEPGNYEVRVAVSNPATNEVASVFSDVTIPEFGRAPLALSDVIVDAAETPSLPAATPRPTMSRTFSRGNRVRALVQIYQGTQRTGTVAAVTMRVMILDATGTSVRDESLAFPENTFSNRRAECVVALPTASLPRGDYLLKLEASLGHDTARRALPFRVE